jgi:hypothetical protein
MLGAVELANRLDYALALLLHHRNLQQNSPHHLLAHAPPLLQHPELLHQDWNIDEVFIEHLY